MTLMTRHYLDLGSASDWLKQISLLARPFRSTIQYGNTALVSQTYISRANQQWRR